MRRFVLQLIIINNHLIKKKMKIERDVCNYVGYEM